MPAVRRVWLVMSLVAMSTIAPAVARPLAEVQVYDRTAGETLPIHRHRGRLYVAGEPGHRYEVRIANQSEGRLLAVASVDGVNVVTGQTASPAQRGYVIHSHESVTIEGWRKSLDEVATFYFTTLGDSYAARTGRPDHVGVIGVALFPERHRCCARLAEKAEAARAAPDASNDTLAQERRDSRLGTGHGERASSAAQYVDFERASERAEETIVIYYDSARRLAAQGIIQTRPKFPQQPHPFPGGFVRDP